MEDFKFIGDYVVPLAVGVFTWLTKDRILDALNIKRAAVEVDDARIRTIQGNLDLYQEMLTDIETRYRARLFELEEELEKFKGLTKQLQDVVERQEQIIDNQNRELALYKLKQNNGNNN